MHVTHACGRRCRELRFPECLAPSLSLGLAGWACSRAQPAREMSWDWGCPALLHFHPFNLVNEPVLRYVCSHVHHALINYVISLFLSKRWWTFKSQIKALFYFMKLWSCENSSLILILITVTYSHLKPALETQHAPSLPQTERTCLTIVACQV